MLVSVCVMSRYLLFFSLYCWLLLPLAILSVLAIVIVFESDRQDVFLLIAWLAMFLALLLAFIFCISNILASFVRKCSSLFGVFIEFPCTCIVHVDVLVLLLSRISLARILLPLMSLDTVGHPIFFSELFSFGWGWHFQGQRVSVETKTLQGPVSQGYLVSQ